MTTGDEMTIDERSKYLGTIKKRYAQVYGEGRGQLFDEMEGVAGLHRKSLTQPMKGNLERT